jgi:lipopolysaccharide transport system ATP-binding protein
MRPTLPYNITMNSVISMKDVSFLAPSHSIFRKSQKEILSSISLEITRGQTLGVIGNNGAGKSSLLKLISGVIKPSSGVVTHAPNVRVALLTLQACIDTNLSGYHNAILYLMFYNLSRRQAEALIPQIIEFSELGEQFYDPVYTFSSGMKARLTFSIAYCIEPEVILIDEMLGVGDQNFREKSSKAITDKIQHPLSLSHTTC